MDLGGQGRVWELVYRYEKRVSARGSGGRYSVIGVTKSESTYEAIEGPDGSAWGTGTETMDCLFCRRGYRGGGRCGWRCGIGAGFGCAEGAGDAVAFRNGVDAIGGGQANCLAFA